MLDLFFEKYAWTANLVLLFAAAWISAQTVNIAVGAGIRQRPQAVTAPSSAPVRTQQPLAHLEPEALYPLVGLERPKPEAEQAAVDPVAEAPRTCTDRLASPVKTSMRALLVASAVAERRQYSLASIQDLSTRETHLYSIGDSVMGATLLSVERVMDDNGGLGDATKIVAVICNRGTKEFIDENAESGPGPNLGVAPVPMGRMPDPGGPSPVVKMGENRYGVPKSYIENNLNNLNNVATQARLFPNYKGGNPNGFRVVQIQPGSLYSSIGLENGDVIQRINGYEMNSPDKALEIYQKLKESSHITLEIERNGQSVRKEYNVTP